MKIGKSASLWLFIALFIGYFTYLHRFQHPQAPFWDENYHVTAAQKYLNGIFFMEHHPPLGKLLIAAGEKILHLNKTNNDTLINADYNGAFPQNFNFKGYRLFPALCGYLTIIPIFLSLEIILASGFLAFLFTGLYLYQNAMIVHMRGAMLDPIMIFFGMVCTTLALLLYKENLANRRGRYLKAFGFIFGLIAATKLLGMVVLFLLIPYFWPLMKNLKKDFKGFVKPVLQIAVPALISFCLVWLVHFAIGTRVNQKLQNGGFYLASEETKQHLAKGEVFTPMAYFHHLRDALKYSAEQNKGIPLLNYCKPDETGSAPWVWPLGGRSISYRWETPGDGKFRHLYLQVNPLAWWICSLATLLLLFMLLFEPWKLKESGESKFGWGLFWSVSLYYLILSHESRVMYLYYGFTPQILSILALALVLKQFTFEPKQLRKLQVASVITYLAVIGVFLDYAKLTYYKPISDRELQAREITPIFDLRCTTCAREWLYMVGCPKK